jgi:hypothetical protein
MLLQEEISDCAAGVRWLKHLHNCHRSLCRWYVPPPSMHSLLLLSVCAVAAGGYLTVLLACGG